MTQDTQKGADRVLDEDPDQDADDLLPGVDEDVLEEDDLDTDRVTRLDTSWDSTLAPEMDVPAARVSLYT